jgi:hypothetical protein
VKRIAILIATTGGPVLVDRITPEPAPQSMVCLRRQSDVLPISADYDDFVRAGSGVIMREFGPYEEGAFRLDVSGPIGTGQSWQLGVFAAHAIFKSETAVLSDLETADLIVWLTGTVDYDLNVADVDHMAQKVESSAFVLADYIAKGTPILFGAGLENAQFLADHRPPDGITVCPLNTTHDLLEILGLVANVPETVVEESERSSKSFILMAVLTLAALVALYLFLVKDHAEEEVLQVQTPLEINLTSDRGKNPIFFFGDYLNLMVEVSEAAWVQCFYAQADGKTFRIYPNDQVKEVTRFEPNRLHILSGGENSSFAIKLGPPEGREEVACYASLQNIDIDPARPPKDSVVDVLHFDLKP